MGGTNGKHPNGNGRSGKTGRKTGKLVPQPHGGAILDGAAPPENHVPGPGRPPSRVKSALRKDFDARREILNEIADGGVRIDWIAVCPECGYEGDELDEISVLAAVGQAPKVSDRIKALEVMAKFSDLDGDKIDRGLIEELGNAVMAEVQDEEVVGRIRERWVRVVAERLAGD